jgi:GH35 family endo-1,4-beta-xylanase
LRFLGILISEALFHKPQLRCNNKKTTMKKLLIATFLTCALAVAASAAEGDTKPPGEPKKKATPAAEQKAARKELIEKYDTNKNGRLDKGERSKMTPEDQTKWENAPAAKKKPAEEKK